MVITTRYLGPTRCKGSRVSATSSYGKTIILPWDNAHNPEENHRLAARALIARCQRSDTQSRWIGGMARGGERVWVAELDQIIEPSNHHNPHNRRNHCDQKRL